jgi:DNA-binding transcriptional LysR family regulator
MHSLDWDDVRHFLAVARSGSVSGAARDLGVNQTTVSRRVSALEGALGKALFERTGSGWLITPVGERLAETAARMAEEAETIERQAAADSQELRGKLRVTLGDICTQTLAMPALRDFTARYPEVELEILATNAELNLAAREADLAIRSTDHPPLNVVGKRAGQLAYGVYGVTTLRDRVQAAEQHPGVWDSDGIPCITWVGDGQSLPPWITESFPHARRIYRANGLAVMLRMAEQGMGIAQLPRAIADPHPALHPIPARHVEPGWGLWVLSHVDLRATARVRILRDFLVEALEEQLDLIEGRRL